MTRMAIYCRVSTDAQVKEGDSIQAQLDALRAYAKKNGYEIAGEYIDNGVSGTLLDERDELQRMLDDVRDGKIDLVAFTRLDRYFRSILLA
jgi:DNA invertase Pin-like site-specific DNA recombinase